MGAGRAAHVMEWELSMRDGKAYSDYVFKSRYARMLPDKQRRENWDETVDRYISFFKTKYKSKDVPWDDLREAIFNHEVMPSMRALMTAGPALAKDNVAGYNCAYVALDSSRVFDEIMYILMCGTGVGFSVERREVEKLPIILDEEFKDCNTTITVRDSKVGWATAYRDLIRLLYAAQVPTLDYSNIRKAGSPLATFGGRASGPEPLRDLVQFTTQLFRGAKGRRLTSLECHDLICKIAEVVVCGGVRRSALLSLSNLTDQQMRNAKYGDWYTSQPQRALANNSVVYTAHPDMGIFMEEWLSLYRSKSGERGIFNREAARNMVPDRRDPDHNWGTNPCSEIVLRPKQFCNLTEVILRSTDKRIDIRRKVRLATILGTLQAGLTDFRYLSAQWKKNTEEERLLGVSLTGIMDHPWLNGSGKMPSDYADSKWTLEDDLKGLKNHAISVNKKYAGIIGIPEATAITCVKPSGTVSQLCNTSSGIHPRYAPYYIRRVRADANDPLCSTLISQGVPCEESRNNNRELIFSFPIQSPKGAISIEGVSAVGQMELWKTYALAWCEHKPSCTVYVREHEWLDVAAWVWANWDICNGLSFFPLDDHIYPQAPYEEISEEAYRSAVAKFPKELKFEIVEQFDVTTASQEPACTGGQCDL